MLDLHNNQRHVVPLWLAIGEGRHLSQNALNDLLCGRPSGGVQQVLEPLLPPQFAVTVFGFGDAIRVGDKDVVSLQLEGLAANCKSTETPTGGLAAFKQKSSTDSFARRTTIGGLWPAFTYFNTRVEGSYSA